jgi:hypothetical protein
VNRVWESTKAIEGPKSYPSWFCLEMLERARVAR